MQKLIFEYDLETALKEIEQAIGQLVSGKRSPFGDLTLEFKNNLTEAEAESVATIIKKHNPKLKLKKKVKI